MSLADCDEKKRGPSPQTRFALAAAPGVIRQLGLRQELQYFQINICIADE